MESGKVDRSSEAHLQCSKPRRGTYVDPELYIFVNTVRCYFQRYRHQSPREGGGTLYYQCTHEGTKQSEWQVETEASKYHCTVCMSLFVSDDSGWRECCGGCATVYVYVRLELIFSGQTDSDST